MNKNEIRIMVVEDEYLVAEEIIRTIKKSGYNFAGEASDGKEALDTVNDIKPDVILMDIKMPVMGGLEATIKIHEKYSVPIIALTSHESKEILTAASEVGMAAYLTKPPNSSELDKAIIIALARHNDLMELKLLNEKLKVEIERRIESEQALKTLAETDVLTGLLNRRRLFEIADLELKRSHRYNHNLSILILDIDYFKKVNDTYGHQIGDLVLKDVSTSLQDITREIDIVARYGGEEFIILMPETDRHSGFELAERVRQTIEQLIITKDDLILSVTVSIGVTECIGTDSFDKALARADSGLYEAKEEGRNRTKLVS